MSCCRNQLLICLITCTVSSNLPFPEVRRTLKTGTAKSLALWARWHHKVGGITRSVVLLNWRHYSMSGNARSLALQGRWHLEVGGTGRSAALLQCRWHCGQSGGPACRVPRAAATTPLNYSSTRLQHFRGRGGGPESQPHVHQQQHPTSE